LRTGPGAQALVVEGQGTARDVDELSQPGKKDLEDCADAALPQSCCSSKITTKSEILWPKCWAEGLPLHGKRARFTMRSTRAITTSRSFDFVLSDYGDVFALAESARAGLRRHPDLG
jgi:hypothetical protein